MACIYQMSSGLWRVQISRHGVRKSKSFGTKEDAEQWAARTEGRVLAKAPLYDERFAARLLQSVPYRVLQAIKEAPFKKNDITDDAIAVGCPSGIYFLILRDEVMYVGKSKNVFRRIGRHLDEGKRFDSFNIVYAPEDKLADLERLYLNALVPPWNHTLEGPAPYRRRAEQPEPALEDR